MFQNGYFKDEVVPVTVKPRRGPEVIVAEDEEFKKIDFEKLKTLKPAFLKEG